MSKNAHTPGPWFHHGPSGSEHTAGGFIKSTKDRNGSPVICSIYGVDGQPYKANAALITAAPDLLCTLERLLENHTQLVNCGDCGNWDVELEPEVISARAAIARARGES